MPLVRFGAERQDGTKDQNGSGQSAKPTDTAGIHRHIGSRLALGSVR
jgi:hypothetical protein